MAMHHEIFKRAQVEVDRLSPPDQLPNLADVESMSYVMATIKETLRWNPALPFGDFSAVPAPSYS
jgi:cytochrome P450